MYQKALNIIEGARRVPFSEGEVRALIDAVKIRRTKGTDLSVGHPLFTREKDDVIEAANEGVIFLHSPEQLAAGFLFLKLDAGRGLFGGQKAVFASYVGTDLRQDEWEAGTTFKSWLIATTSIGNIYRSEGYR